jgi:hypothetical protein
LNEELGPEDRGLIKAAVRGLSRPETEYANADGRGLSAYEGLARHAGVAMSTVVEYAEQGRLGELVERRAYTRRLSGAEALRQINAAKYAPGTKPKSGAEAIGELRALRLVWDAEGAEADRRDPHRRLAELRAKRLRWEE